MGGNIHFMIDSETRTRFLQMVKQGLQIDSEYITTKQ